MITRAALINYLDELLQPSKWNDYGPNGLQVEGTPEIRKIATAVSASLASITAAAEHKADLLLVHHGIFWKNEPLCVIGPKYQRVRALIEAQMNLVGFHLPLDAHETLGNNVQLGSRLGIADIHPVELQGEKTLVFKGRLSTPMTASAFAQHLEKMLNRTPLHIEGPQVLIEQLAWCTGGAQGYCGTAISAGCDAYISGEISEHTVHLVRESGIHYFAAGHHATERYGVQALGEHLAERFGVEHLYLEIDNPV